MFLQKETLIYLNKVISAVRFVRGGCVLWGSSEELEQQQLEQTQPHIKAWLNQQYQKLIT